MARTTSRKSLNFCYSWWDSSWQ